MTSKDKSYRLLFLFPWSLLFLEVLHFLLRWRLLNSPFFSELDYDEGVIGLMALHILRGEPQLMLWGLPRMGGLEAYLASFIFYLFGPSTFALQFSLVLISSVILFTIYAIGGKMGGPKAGIIAAAYWAIPPVFLSFTGNYVTGGHLEAVLAGALILYCTCTFSSLPIGKTAILIALIGVLSGIGFWSSLLIFPFLLAAAIGLVGTRPRILWSPLIGIGIVGYFLCSLSFWSWNFFHDFNTLIHLGGKDLLSIAHHLFVVIMTIFPTFIGIFWDGHGIVSSIPKLVTDVVLIGFYLPLLVWSLIVVFLWLKRIGSKQLPFQGPIDYIVLSFWFYILVRASGEPKELGLTRYTMALYVPISILVSLWIIKIMDFRKALGIGIFVGFLGFNLWTNVLYLNQDKNNPIRPIDKLISTFQESGIRYCYADSRISQVITFESKETIIGSDYYGWRNYDYLRMVDRAPSQEVAIVTHRKMGNPYPEAMESSLQLLGAAYEKKEVGEYVFFYHFKRPDSALRSIPAGQWKVTASKEPGQCFLLKDRDILTTWRIPKRAGEWLQIDLGGLKKVGQISILSSPIESGLPYQFKLEISRDGRSWKSILEVKDYIPGLYWHNNLPRLDKNLCLQMVFPPLEGRYLRITNLYDVENPNDPWAIAELFIYEMSSQINPIPEQALKNLDQAKKNLNHWMDDPTGPQPSPLGISLNFRKKQIDWQALIQSASRAIQEVPDWEEAHQLLGQAFMLGDFLNNSGVPKGKPLKNPLDLFPQKNLSLIPSKHWKVTSSNNSPEARLAVDENPFTRWASLKGQETGMFFQVDLGGDYQVNGFSLFWAAPLMIIHAVSRSCPLLTGNIGKIFRLTLFPIMPLIKTNYIKK